MRLGQGKNESMGGGYLKHAPVLSQTQSPVLPLSVADSLIE